MLLRDLRKGKDVQIASIIAVIATVAPDVLLLTDFDYDFDSMALSAFVQSLGAAGLTYDHMFASRPNTGLPTGLDMDGNGCTGEARDVQGYGWFSGDGGMAVLSRFPIDQDNVENLSDILWRDVAVGPCQPLTGCHFHPSKRRASNVFRPADIGSCLLLRQVQPHFIYLPGQRRHPYLTDRRIETVCAIAMNC